MVMYYVTVSPAHMTLACLVTVEARDVQDREEEEAAMARLMPPRLSKRLNTRRSCRAS